LIGCEQFCYLCLLSLLGYSLSVIRPGYNGLGDSFPLASEQADTCRRRQGTGVSGGLLGGWLGVAGLQSAEGNVGAARRRDGFVTV